MANILYLVHRLPYPPNKGDKVRSYHLLKHLAASHQVYLGTFIDDPADEAYVETVRGLCADLYVARLSPRKAKLRSAVGLFTDEALTLPYYRDGGLRSWIGRLYETQQLDTAVIFSSAMAQYVRGMYRLPCIVDFVDVDSAKWTQYADQHKWPMSWVYRREGEQLLRYERAVAAKSARSFFVTEKETALFAELAPECAIRVETMANGVDSEFFAPSETFVSPYHAGDIPVVFTGAMDYWPNIDAAQWFVESVLPELCASRPQIKFFVVGRNPPPELQALASDRVVVTGTVPDVRPYLQHARVVVAPLRVARGIQNKILEAMAMARPVIASTACAGGVDAAPGKDFFVAESVQDYVAAVDNVLSSEDGGQGIGVAARKTVVDRYSWAANMATVDRYLEPGAALV